MFEGHFPLRWKKAHVTPVKKSKKVKNPEKELRPISVTSPVGKIYEHHLNQIVLNQVHSKLDQQHFGSIKGSSTTCALVDMTNFLYTTTDNPNMAVNLCFYDLSKGFDRVDYNILMDILHQWDVHPCILSCIRSFLTDRVQRVCLQGDLKSQWKSQWKSVPAGIPQGSVLGPTLFLIAVNSLAYRETWRWKYMDDITIAEHFPVSHTTNMQASADRIAQEVTEKNMRLNPTKCKEMNICFKREKPQLPNIVLDDKEIEKVSSHKILGLFISDDLTWNSNIEAVISKASKRIYPVRLLKRAGVEGKELTQFYTTCIRSVMEYACPAWFYSLPHYLVEHLESIQRRIMNIVYPNDAYAVALEKAQLPTMEKRLQYLCEQFFNKIQHPSHKLHGLLPDVYTNRYNTRSQARGLAYSIPAMKTKRAMNSFIIKSCRLWNSAH